VLEISGTSAVFGVAPQLSLDGELAETLCALLGAIVVLVAGTVWRERKLTKSEEVVLSADAAAPSE